ncbi:MAG: hypothetical protein IJG07_11595 [Prevotella sp.]|nr:hypothetical protein [Prevotella sp.]
MAAGTSLVIAYESSDGGTTTHTWKYAKPSATPAQVQALIAATISSTNNVIFSKVPIAVKSAKMVTTTETEYDLNEVMQANGRDLRHLINRTDPEGELTSYEEDLSPQLAEIARLKAKIAELQGR